MKENTKEKKTELSITIFHGTTGAPYAISFGIDGCPYVAPRSDNELLNIELAVDSFISDHPDDGKMAGILPTFLLECILSRLSHEQGDNMLRSLNVHIAKYLQCDDHVW